MKCGKLEHQPGQKCAAKNAKCKECHKIGHFHKVCQSKKRGRRAHLVQTTSPQSEQDSHIDENGVRQPNPSLVNMLKIVNHIGATKGSQEKHLKCMVLIPHLNMDLAWFVGCCFSCSCCSINALGNAVRVYPETVQGLTFYCSKNN